MKNNFLPTKNEINNHFKNNNMSKIKALKYISDNKFPDTDFYRKNCVDIDVADEAVNIALSDIDFSIIKDFKKWQAENPDEDYQSDEIGEFIAE